MAGEININASLVRRLIAAQFPQWADLPVRPVDHDGWDNRTFRLGDEMAVRLPSAERYVAQVEKEHAWLPKLAPQLPLAIPTPLAMGRPGAGYPWPWSVYRWLDGEIATKERIVDVRQFATTLAEFLVALYEIDPSGGPPPGAHNFFRGGPVATYDEQTRQAIAALDGKIDTVAVTEVWDAALAARWDGPPVWVHGDVAPGNLLVRDGRLGSVIDFGCSAVGDPACDLVIAWTFLEGEALDAFRSALPLDEGAWARGRGWALWKALIVAAGISKTIAIEARNPRRTIDQVIADHRLRG